MECELWPRLYALVREVAKTHLQKRAQYCDWIIVLVMLWAVLHDRPTCWACQMSNWMTTRLRPVFLPSESTMSRRLMAPSVLQLMASIEDRIRGLGYPPLIKILDGKPLIVGGCSKDPDATAGRATRGMARGYKLHAVWSERPLPEAWEVRPLHENESRVAHQLLPRLRGAGYILADNQLDSNALYDLAMLHGHQLIAPPKKGRKGLGHHRHSPHRLRSLALLRRPFGAALFQYRNTIERSFAHATSFGGGLAPLPAWVRRLHRVTRWVWAKLLINAVRIQNRKALAV
jgi:hypothetical protein